MEYARFLVWQAFLKIASNDGSGSAFEAMFKTGDRRTVHATLKNVFYVRYRKVGFDFHCVDESFAMGSSMRRLIWSLCQDEEGDSAVLASNAVTVYFCPKFFSMPLKPAIGDPSFCPIVMNNKYATNGRQQVFEHSMASVILKAILDVTFGYQDPKGSDSVLLLNQAVGRPVRPSMVSSLNHAMFVDCKLHSPPPSPPKIRDLLELERVHGD